MPFLKVTKGNNDELYPCGPRVSVERFAGSIRIVPREPGEGCPESITLPAEADKVYLVDNGVTVTGWKWPPPTSSLQASIKDFPTDKPAKETL